MSKAVFDQTTFDASAFDQEEGIFRKPVNILTIFRSLAGTLASSGVIIGLVKRFRVLTDFAGRTLSDIIKRDLKDFTGRELK